MTPESEKLIAATYLSMHRLIEEFQAFVHQEGRPRIPEGWMSGVDAAAALKPEGVKSARHLQRLRLDGAFSDSKHAIRNVSKGNRPTWEYHIPSCRKALQRYFRSV